MDQVRVIVKLIWRERFWVLSVLGTLVAVACWHLATGDLDKEFKSRKSSIESSFKSMRDLGSKPVHPNDDVNQGDMLQAKEQRENVLNVWKQLYDRQRQEVLYWPKGSLKPEFIDEIEKLRFRDPFPAHKAEFMRNHYWNYIENRFDGLLEIVQAQKTSERGSSSFGGRGGGRDSPYGGEEGYGGEGAYGGRGLAALDPDQENQDYLVQWLDQGNVRDELHFAKKPSAVQIWVTQEDLWVYETLLNVIANTNKLRKATRPDNTAVRVIVNLEVGKKAAEASRTKSRILIPSVEGIGGDDPYGGGRGGESGGGRGEMDEGGYGGRGGYGEGGRDDGMSDTDVLAHRYLDAEGQPYPGDAENFGIEYRQLPIRMKLMMDQRWLPQLLVECANAALPIEVNQLRVNPEQSGAGFGGGGSRGGMSTGRSSMRGAVNLPPDPNLANVEIQAVVYIYNQPDKEELSVPGLEEDQLAADTL